MFVGWDIIVCKDYFLFLYSDNEGEFVCKDFYKL